VADPAFLSPALDLSRLPAPAVVQPLSYDRIRADLIAALQARLPSFDATVASDPVIKLLEISAYRELLLRGAINDAARSVLLAFATGADLDQLGAFYGVERLVIIPATDRAPAILESDADLRTRIQLAPETLAAAGLTGGGYRATALRVAPSVRDVAVIKRAAGRVDVVLLGRDGDGAVPTLTVQRVYQALAADDGAQLTDIVSVRSAEILPYARNVRLRIRRGPDPAIVGAAAEAAIRLYATDRHRVGHTVYAQMLESAASVGGVEQAIVDGGDVVPAPHQAPYLTGLTVTVEIAA
jgi:phage-related baseplate assembly protein